MNSSAPICPMASLYVGDLHPDVTEAMLVKIFSPVGPIHSVRVCRDKITRRSLGYAYVNFQQPADAERALDNMNFHVIKGQPLRMMWAQRDSSLRQSGVGNIFIKNLDKSIDSVNLYDTFSAFGKVLSCKVACDEEGSKGYGFVHFENPEAAERAIKRLNGMLFNDKEVFIGPFKSHHVREAEIEPKSEQLKEDRETRYQQGVNLCIKNLHHSVDDERLLKVFSPFGSITNAKVVMDGGHSKGFGFVQFSSPEEATRAVREMNGRMVATKPVHVALIHRKGERQAHLTNAPMQRTASAVTNLILKPHQPAPPSGYFMSDIPRVRRPSLYNKWHKRD